METDRTIAEALAARLAAWGVERLFGVPGGGSLRLIEAAARLGVPFVLARTETAAVLMAAATGEITGRPGAAVVGVGPGLASAANGMAYAALDRAPVALIADALDDAERGRTAHQALDQPALMAPLTKGCVRLDGGSAVDEAVDAAVAAALTPPRGPVLIELPGADAACPARRGGAPLSPPRPAPARALDAAGCAALLRRARRPALVVGLEVRGGEAAQAVRRFARRLGAPVLTTYKAKGAVADSDPLHAGLYTGAEAEAPVLRRADLIVQIGLDPVEVQPRPRRYDAPVLDVGEAAGRAHHVRPQAASVGPIAEAVAPLAEAASPSEWRAEEIAALRREMRAALASPQGGPVTPQELVDAVRRAAPEDARAAVDAGAHMVAATVFYPARRPGDMLISNGLSTMGFALPAAIAAAFAEPGRRAVAFTGDGGLAMCAGELATAAEHGLPVVVAAFNDSALSLIDVKQRALGHPPRGVRTGRVDFARVAEGMGCAGFRVEEAGALAPALAAAFATPGPSVVDVRVDASGYPAQIEALRGRRKADEKEPHG